MPVQYTIAEDSNSRFLKPVGSGAIDVVNDMPWTLSPKSARGDVPYVKLTEYQQTTGQLQAAVAYYSRVVNNVVQNGIGTVVTKDDPFEVYKYKYFADPTGFTYRLPYFNPKKTARGNSFDGGENPFQSLIDIGAHSKAYHNNATPLGRIAEGVGWVQAGIGVLESLTPAKLNFEYPSHWEGTDLETIEVTFDLFNTTSETDVEANRNLCHLLNYQNTPSRRNFALVDPPAIYSLEIADIAAFPACYVSSLTITNLGNTRLMKVGGVTRTIPEAYRIALVFKALLMPTRNILGAMDKGSTVQAINDYTPFGEAYEEATDSVLKGLKDSQDKIYDKVYDGASQFLS